MKISSVEQLQQAEQALFQIFSGIDSQVKKNMRRVLAAFRQYQVVRTILLEQPATDTRIWGGKCSIKCLRKL